MAFGLETFVFKVFIIQFFGFVCLLMGNFIYNEIIEIKFFGLNKNLRKYKVMGSIKSGVSDE